MKFSAWYQPSYVFEPHKSRLTAAFMRGALLTITGVSLITVGGCSAIENTPTGQAINLLSPSSGAATAEQAQNIAFASLALNTSAQRGLVVLGAQGREQTHWPISGGGLLKSLPGWALCHFHASG